MSHSHPHSQSAKNIKTAFFLNLVFTIFEIVGGFMFNSLAILTDALHDFGDSLSLGLSWYFEKLALKGRSQKFTYGYKRFSLLAAIINSVVLIVGGLFILSEAIPRLMHPEHSNARGMFLFAVIGVVINGWAALKVAKGKKLNDRVVMWHLLEDVIGWGAVLVVSVVLNFWNIPILDPLLSILITLFVLWNAVRYLRKSAGIFLQVVPESFTVQNLEEVLRSTKGVQDIHDLHVWTLDGESNILSAHVVVSKDMTTKEMLDIKCALKQKLLQEGIDHATLEMEIAEESCGYEKC